jgi:phage terminase large subunit-like protein
MGWEDAMSKLNNDDYEVGYGKPPASSRFRKGQSGNRSGRPKGTKNLKTDLLEAFAPEHDKITRMSAQSSKIEAGQVYLPQQAEWLDDFRAELLQFPHGRYDDQADSLSQFLNWIDRPSGNRCAVQQIFL